MSMMEMSMAGVISTRACEPHATAMLAKVCSEMPGQVVGLNLPIIRMVPGDGPQLWSLREPLLLLDPTVVSYNLVAGHPVNIEVEDAAQIFVVPQVLWDALAAVSGPPA